jgi:cell division protein FtsB
MLRLFIVTLIILNAFMFYTLIWTQGGALRFLEVRETYQKLENDNQDLIEENKRLSRSIVALRDDEDYIKAAIRREMRFVKDNEVIYFFTRDQAP